MLIWFGLILIAVNLILRWRWRWLPDRVTALGAVIGGYLIASELVSGDRGRLMMGVVIVFGGGLYLMALTGLALRAHLENQRVHPGGVGPPGKGTSVPTVRAARVSKNESI